jgi:uncharacterized protein (TIGR00295 family)
LLSYEQAFRLLTGHGKDEPWVRHCVAVSRVAGRLAEVIGPKSTIDARLLTVGALLHDIGRYKTQDPILHGVEGYRLLLGLGHHREAFICASHVLCGMPSHEAVRYGLPERDFIPQTLEERIIPLIDSVVELDRPTTLEERCSSISRRYKNNVAFLKRFEQAAETARSHLRMLDKDFGVSLERVAIAVLGTDRSCRTASRF